MHPTIDEQLQGARRLLERLATEGELPASSAGLLTDVLRILRQVEASWCLLLPFLTADNAALRTLLEGLTPLLPELSDRTVVVPHERGSKPDLSVLDVRTATTRNAELRADLSRAIAMLPDTEAGSEARAQIAAYSRARVERDPG